MKWQGNLIPHMLAFDTAFELGLEHHNADVAQKVEDYAKEHAPWEDQTGDARSGLTAEAGRDGFHHFIVLYHTVEYGVWLEVRWGGRFAIIEPTINHFGGELMGELTFGALLGSLL